jgi:hypothetical protein
MLLVLTKILKEYNKKMKYNQTKVSRKVSCKDKKVSQKEKFIDFQLTVSKPVIELCIKLLNGVKDDLNFIDFERGEKEQLTFEVEKHIQLLDFIKSNASNGGKLPKESEMLNAMNIKSWELKELKRKLFEEGYLIKPNERVFLLKI